MTMRRPYAIGNWKMHGLGAEVDEAAEIHRAAQSVETITTLLCLPATLVHRVCSTGMSVGGQDCHHAPRGAHTGDTSAEMLADAVAQYVILGHSERRTDHGETDETIAAKVKAAWDAGLTAIICIGETETQYRAGTTLDVLKRQLSRSVPNGANAGNTIIAYEPVWAIGTGLTPSSLEIETTHAAIRVGLSSMMPEGEGIPILYGGSVNARNAAEIFSISDVDGGLVGGASLRAKDFTPILLALSKAKGDS